MAFDEMLLTMDDIQPFMKWLSSHKIKHRPGKGQWEVLQVYIKDGWRVICRNSKDKLSSHKMLRPFISGFKGGVSFGGGKVPPSLKVDVNKQPSQVTKVTSSFDFGDLVVEPTEGYIISDVVRGPKRGNRSPDILHSKTTPIGFVAWIPSHPDEIPWD